MPSVPSVTPRPAGRARGAGAVLRGFVPRSGRESHDGEGTATPAGREWREARPRDPVLDAPRRLKATAARTSRRLRPALGPGAWRTRSRLETVLPPSQRPDATRAPFANVLRGDRSHPARAPGSLSRSCAERRRRALNAGRGRARVLSTEGIPDSAAHADGAAPRGTMRWEG